MLNTGSLSTESVDKACAEGQRAVKSDVLPDHNLYPWSLKAKKRFPL